ncbi:MAG: hypothetical protein EBE86_017605 [Hormoscilla sp. GUM202]|nr:hypothetical protein [Hormoscilla sp. GUM202]
MKKPGFVEKLGFWASIAGNSTFRSPQPRSKTGMDPCQVRSHYRSDRNPK